MTGAAPGPGPTTRRLMLWLALAAALYVGYCALLAAARNLLLFPIRNEPGTAARTAPAGAESWWLDIGDGHRIEAWWFPAAGATPARPGPAVVYLHGNADLIDHAVGIAEAYQEAGVSALLIEYRGYGRSGGSPGITPIRRDLVAWYDRLATLPQVDRRRIGVHGYSLGAAFAAQLASQRPASALFLEAPFRSLVAMARRHGVWLYLSRERLDTEGILRLYPGPVLIRHGVDDRLIPVEHGRALAQVAPHARLVEVRGGHAAYDDWPGYLAELRAFAATVRGEGAP